MANTLTNLIPDIYAALDVVSRELVGFIPAVGRDSSADRVAINQTLRIPISPANAAGSNITTAMAFPSAADQTFTNKTLTITKSRFFPFSWSGQEEMAVNSGVGYLTLKQDQIAQAIGRRTGSRMVPSGAVAANLFGLSTQVPAKFVYLSDGRSRRLHVGKIEIQIRHVTPKELPLGSQTSAMVFQALRYLGKDQVDDQVIRRLKSTLRADQKRELAQDARYTTDWIADAIRQIAGRGIKESANG